MRVPVCKFLFITFIREETSRFPNQNYFESDKITYGKINFFNYFLFGFFYVHFGQAYCNAIDHKSVVYAGNSSKINTQ